MPNMLLVPVQMLGKLTQKPAKEISICVANRIAYQQTRESL